MIDESEVGKYEKQGRRTIIQMNSSRKAETSPSPLTTSNPARIPDGRLVWFSFNWRTCALLLEV